MGTRQGFTVSEGVLVIIDSLRFQSDIISSKSILLTWCHSEYLVSLLISLSLFYLWFQIISLKFLVSVTGQEDSGVYKSVLSPRHFLLDPSHIPLDYGEKDRVPDVSNNPPTPSLILLMTHSRTREPRKLTTKYFSRTVEGETIKERVASQRVCSQGEVKSGTHLRRTPGVVFESSTVVVLRTCKTSWQSVYMWKRNI